MKYLSPTCRSIKIEIEPSFAASTQDVSDMKGMTADNPDRLRRLLPIFTHYDELEPDIKENLKKQNPTFNYRMQNIMGLDYDFMVQTYRDETDLCTCIYYQTLANVEEMKRYYVHYNIYDVLELFLVQIRHKEDGVYEYDLSPEVRQKMPTFCKLLSNAYKSFKDPQYGLPVITFLDSEQKYPLLSACFVYDEANVEDMLMKIHESFFRILEQLSEEMTKAGLLDQSRKQLFRNGLRLFSLVRHLFLMS